MVKTDEGFLICLGVPVARIGEMEYLAKELSLGGDPSAIVTVTRDEGEVFSPAAVASFEGKPVTNDHPPEDVAPGNFGAYARGHAQNVRRGSGELADYLLADLYVTDPRLIAEIADGAKREVSCGYNCEYDPSGAGYSQRRIRGNHIAVVREGRAGPEVSIRDSKIRKGGKMMKAKDAKRRKVLDLFARSLRYEFCLVHAKFAAATEEERERLLDDAVAAMGDEGEPQTAEAVVETIKKVVGEAEPEKTEDENPDLAAVLAALKDLAAKVEALTVSKDSDVIDELIGELEEKEKTEDEDETDDPDESIVVDSDEAEPAASKSSDAAFLRAVKPVIAKIADPADRKRVSDAVTKAISGGVKLSKDAVKSVVAAASKRGRDGSPPDLAAQQSAYDRLNPHKRKEN
jgi:hypothetical protein